MEDRNVQLVGIGKKQKRFCPETPIDERKDAYTRMRRFYENNGQQRKWFQVSSMVSHIVSLSHNDKKKFGQFSYVIDDFNDRHWDDGARICVGCRSKLVLDKKYHILTCPPGKH